jgi:hypothetical protein
MKDIWSFFYYESYETCKVYLLIKMIKTSFFFRKSERFKKLLSLIYINVCGPIMICIIGGYTYFITFTDDCSRYVYVYLMKLKFELFKRFKEFRNKVEKQTGKSIKIL